MKFSVLLPTRDRLDLLKLAVESVRRQGYSDFEIVISDNNSKEPVAPWVKSLADPRVQVLRFDESVSVTQNWNNALQHANGEYAIMLGDDDALCSNYFTEMSRLLSAEDRPDCVYSGAYLFTYPGVVPGAELGSVHESRNALFWRDGKQNYYLSQDQRLALVNDAMGFYNSYGFNMQFVTVRRDLMLRLGGDQGFYRTQYPDYFAMNHLLLHAESFLVTEAPLVSIGVSSSSFGWYYQNFQEAEGNSHLSIDQEMRTAAGEISRQVLPGTSMNTNWLTSMVGLYDANRSFEGLKSPSLPRYRRKQIIYFALLISRGKVQASEISDFTPRLSLWERSYYYCLRSIAFLGKTGQRVLQGLHVLSQKRYAYVLKVLFRRLKNEARTTPVLPGTTILAAESLARD